MTREFSAGGIVFKKEGSELLFLLVRNFNPSRNVNHWGFPKGHLEKDEKSVAAAIREVKEETNIDAKVIKKVADSKYFFYVGGEKIFKTVAFFLMSYTSGEVQHQASELAEAGWFNYDTSLEKITFEAEKNLLKEANEMIDAQ